ncbi:MAG: xylulokinase [Firmicutes bacterium]|nr:xylulokinase [Bacillota bacterium]
MLYVRRDGEAFMNQLYLGIDIGTSSTKSIVIDGMGEVHGFGRAAYDNLNPQTGWVEQDPDVWYQAVVDSVREALGKVQDSRSIAGIGMTGQMHGLVMLDAELKPLAPAVLWPDLRAADEVQSIKREYGNRLFELIGGPIATGFLLVSFLWMKRNRPDIYSKIHVVLTPKDYIRLRLTGEVAMDPSDACGTGAFLPAVSQWAVDLLEDLGLDPEVFPRIIRSSAVAGMLLSGAADALGLQEGIPVATGCGDLQASAMGIGIINSGQLLVNVGTGGQVFQLLDRYAFDPNGRLHTMLHADGKSWHVMGAILAAGLSMSWISRIMEIQGVNGISSLFASSADVIACQEDLYFLPYLVGERTPHMNERLTASFWGLRAEQGKEHLFRAVVEGVAFALRDCYDVLSTLTEKPTVIRAGSGGLKDKYFRQTVADVFGMPVEYTDQSETSSFGAALLAQAGVTGEDLDELIGRSVKTAGVIEPDMNRHRVYEEGFQRYRQLAQVTTEIGS